MELRVALTVKPNSDEALRPFLLDHGSELHDAFVDGAEEPYPAFIRRAAQNPIARFVQLADLEDNMDLSRIAQPTERDHRRIEKYKAAKLVIEKAIAGVG